MNNVIDITQYTYDLPNEKIALFPLPERDQSRLLVYEQGNIQHKRFHEIASKLPADSLLVFNNTKVIQARLLFEKQSGAVIEVFLLHPVLPSPLLIETMQSTGSCTWKCTIGNLKRWKTGTTLTYNSDRYQLTAELKDRHEGIVKFTWKQDCTFAELVSHAGQMPLPPYLKRKPDAGDKERYQTIYSKEEGAVAAPTAGLHFTDSVFASLNDRRIRKDFVTLHVSAGTFQPVKEQNALNHVMHQEQVVVSKGTIESLTKHTGPIIPVGTTSMRTLESVYWFGVKLIQDPGAEFIIGQRDAYTFPQEISRDQALRAVLKYLEKEKRDAVIGETSIFIHPGYKFRMGEGLITNFHQPESTLILLVASFIGDDWRKVYKEALDNGYRFLSYGDSSLLLP